MNALEVIVKTEVSSFQGCIHSCVLFAHKCRRRRQANGKRCSSSNGWTVCERVVLARSRARPCSDHHILGRVRDVNLARAWTAEQFSFLLLCSQSRCFFFDLLQQRKCGVQCRHIGELMHQLDIHGLTANTIVFFASDNGKY